MSGRDDAASGQIELGPGEDLTSPTFPVGRGSARYESAIRKGTLESCLGIVAREWRIDVKELKKLLDRFVESREES